MPDALARVTVKAMVLDRLLSDGWVKIDGATLRVNSDVDLDPRELRVITALINGTEPPPTRICHTCGK